MHLVGLLFVLGAAALQALPPLPSGSDGENEVGFELSQSPRVVYITSDIAETRDSQGLTLIPPSGEEFATTFAQDLTEVSGEDWTVEVVETLPDGPGIGLTQYTGNDTDLSYENETPTEEGYQLDVQDGKITISGAGSRGVWWGTRTVLQYLYLSNFTSVPAMSTTDAPAYATRGYMLDAGRKWYAPSLLKELCTFASFFKLSEFHYHVSDNYPLNRGHNETWQDVYSQFSLRPEDPELLDGLIERVNETLTRDDYADLESHCAARGIAVIPEIEAPGHCLTITKWKPELALEKEDLLNLSHPDSIPTVQRIWDEFLPWFNVKEVHIGADEYNASLADVYIHFVNGMAAHINDTTGKAVRAWGTPFNPPTDPTLHLDPAVIIQHWQYNQSDPLRLQADGHPIINSEDWWAYVSIKNDHMPILPARYPQALNTSRILNFGDVAGNQWSPDLFNPFNTSAEYQLAPNSPDNKGAIMASWNDNGPDASTQLEAYYAWRLGLPLVAARAWSGARGPKVDASSIDASLEFLASRAPAQNLDRRLLPSAPAAASSSPSASGQAAPLFTWTAASAEPLNAGSAGVNHTLVLHAHGPFTLSTGDAEHGNETTLQLTEAGKLIYNADGWPYPLRSVAQGDGFDPGAPGRIWSNVSTSSHEEVTVRLPQGNGTQGVDEGEDELEIVITTTVDGGSRVWIDQQWAGRFEVFVFGGKNTLFSWSQMAFVAPLDGVEGDGLVGLEVWEGERGGEDGSGNGNNGDGNQGEIDEYTAANGTWRGREVSGFTMLTGVVIGLVGWWVWA